MERDRLRFAVLALLAVVAIGLAAATLTSPVERDLGRGPGGSGVGDREGERSNPLRFGLGESASAGGDRASWSFCLRWLRTLEFKLGAIAALAVIGGLAYWRDGALPAAALLVAILWPGIVLYMALSSCSGLAKTSVTGGQTNNSSDTVLGLGGTGGGGNPAATVLSPPIAVAIMAVLIGVTALAFVYLTGDDEEEAVEEVGDAESEEPLSAVGRTAGVAATRIEREDAAVDNEIYLAWRRMTDHLDVANPESTTPGEFADAATAAGMDRRHVDTLTELFRDVRYGEAPPSEDRADRATTALRKIEAAYAGADDGEDETGNRTDDPTGGGGGS